MYAFISILWLGESFESRMVSIMLLYNFTTDIKGQKWLHQVSPTPKNEVGKFSVHRACLLYEEVA